MNIKHMNLGPGRSYIQMEDATRYLSVLIPDGVADVQALRDFANDQRARAVRMIRQADMADAAAIQLEQGDSK